MLLGCTLFLIKPLESFAQKDANKKCRELEEALLKHTWKVTFYKEVVPNVNFNNDSISFLNAKLKEKNVLHYLSAEKTYKNWELKPNLRSNIITVIIENEKYYECYISQNTIQLERYVPSQDILYSCKIELIK